MGKVLVADNASTTLAVDIPLTSTTTFTVASAATFPACTTASGNWFYATLSDNTGAMELVKVTDVTAAMFTCVRNFGATLTPVVGAAKAFTTAALTKVQLRPVASVLNDKAGAGANTDITSLSGLITPLSVAQGGTGSATPNIRCVINCNAGIVTPIPDATTIYMGPNGAHVTENNVSVPMPYAGTITTLQTYAANSGAGSKSYTVMKNGVAQTMTLTAIAPATGGGTAANPVSFAAGDLISVRLVTSGGATTSFHSASLLVQQA